VNVKRLFCAFKLCLHVGHMLAAAAEAKAGTTARPSLLPPSDGVLGALATCDRPGAVGAAGGALRRSVGLPGEVLV